MTDFIKGKGMKHQISCAGTPQQNGVRGKINT